MQKEANKPKEYNGMEVEKLYEFVKSRFFGEEALKAGKNRMLCSPIFN